jgi:GWxTD domain-containing protein
MSVLVLFSSVYGNDEQDRFMEAKKKCMSQEWREAINMLQDFLEEYPASRYADDAQFWIAYSLEKIPGQQNEAFMAFAELVNSQPQSAWTDDAIVHQIDLAQTFVREGKDQYLNFLHQHLNSEHSEVKYRSAIALGQLGDKKALPLLDEMSTNEDYGPLAANLASILRSTPQGVAPDTSREKLRMVYERGIDGSQQDGEPGTAPPRDSFLWFNTQRYEQYRSMLRKDDNWSNEELTQFALWHVLEADQFDEFRTLDNDYDRKEWIRKHWKTKDPTPTTSENELWQEFERRVNYARENFSEPWDYTNFRYLPDEHIRSGWYRAPWDARGELYIKYGEPDTRSVHAFNTEEWVYYKYGVDFLVKKYMTNIYGNAINAGSTTRSMHQDQNFPYQYNYNYVYPYLTQEQQEYIDWNTYNTYLDANFVYKNEMRYFHNYDAEPLSDFEMEINRDDKLLVVRYRFPVDELELMNGDNGYYVLFTERFSILNEDMREVASGANEKRVDGIVDDNVILQEEIKTELQAGSYKISVHIRDINSKKMGIYSKNFTVK